MCSLSTELTPSSSVTGPLITRRGGQRQALAQVFGWSVEGSSPRFGRTVHTDRVRRVVEALLQRIGLTPTDVSPDLDGLFLVHRAYLAAIPYEDLAVQLGETGPLDPASL